MTPRLSRHAESEVERRQIPEDWLDSLLEAPEQRIHQPDGIEIWQSRFTSADGKMFLLRTAAAAKEAPVVVTVYRTSKIEKYWRPE
jgi:hypothetical protein